ncbi:DNA-binding protein Ewg-like [Diabrotica virgifera virgifera]|uniref:Nuclear respiratory factor 1 NLS/DNA-binding dimerisation domain-containing protein n=1 Tax=Diabrotica virgifera virgifera TaxID=50390 RepID=A0ABM5KDL0_DIAVI|nr:DNA-binding protein Ewg-like [Diabrotica virgifera virgifera]
MNNSKENQNAETQSFASVVSDNDDCMSAYEEESDITAAVERDKVTAQLAAAGPVGVAAAAAIVSARKREKLHSFETNPMIRKRQETRLLMNLGKTIDEFAIRVGKQAVVLVATPNSYNVFGAKPLEDVIRNHRDMIMDDLDNALAAHALPLIKQEPLLFDLPPLIIDGIPTPLAKFSQAQLRAFIPLMLKFSTGRGKPGWSRESMRPLWWPEQLPWANIRMDCRSAEEKEKISWTHALRQVVINCYKFHGREDLLLEFPEEDKKINQATKAEADATMQCTPTVLHPITNSDGIYTAVQVDPNNPIITLPDSTTTNFHFMVMGDGNQVHYIQTITDGGPMGEYINLNSVTKATLNSEGHITLTREDGHVSSIIKVPAPDYCSMVAKLQAFQTNSDGTIFATRIFELLKEEHDSNNNGHVNTNLQ